MVGVHVHMCVCLFVCLVILNAVYHALPMGISHILTHRLDTV